MKNTILLFLFATLSLPAFSQCPTGEIYLESQQDITDFLAEYPNCTELSTLEISDDVIDLSDLSVLTKVEYLYLQRCPMLTSLSGLENIDTITGNLGISGEVGFTNLCGLSSLKHIGQDLRIEETSNLLSLEGLNTVIYIEDDITITDNEDLVDLYGLENVLTLGMEADGSHRVEVKNNPALSSCCGVLDLLSNVTGLNVDISNNNDGCQTETEIMNSDCNFDYNPCGIIDNTIELPNRYSVYPNPVKSEMFIVDAEGKLLDVKMLQLIDLDGRLIQSLEVAVNGWTVDHVKSGIYVIRFTVDSESIVRRVFISNQD